jgi:hypothetical protein
MLPLHFSLYQSVLFCVHLQHVSSDFRRPPCRCYCSVPSCIAQTSGVGYTRSSRCDGLLMIPPLLIALFRLLQGEWSMLHKSFKMWWTADGPAASSLFCCRGIALLSNVLSIESQNLMWIVLAHSSRIELWRLEITTQLHKIAIPPKMIAISNVASPRRQVWLHLNRQNLHWARLRLVSSHLCQVHRLRCQVSRPLSRVWLHSLSPSSSGQPSSVPSAYSLSSQPSSQPSLTPSVEWLRIKDRIIYYFTKALSAFLQAGWIVQCSRKGAFSLSSC